MFSCYLFDLDGTLVNSLADLAAASNWVLAQAGLPTHPEGAYRHFVGDGAFKLVERMLPAHMRDEATVAEYKARFDARYGSHYADKTTPYPGVLALLSALQEKGAKIAVISNKPDPFVQQICRELFAGSEFDAILGQQAGIRKKPAPDGVFALLEALGVEKPQAILIGDSDVDVKTAKNAGTLCAGACWGFRGREELASAGADFLVETPLDILTLSKSGV